MLLTLYCVSVQFSEKAESRRSSGERVWLPENGNASMATAKDKGDTNKEKEKGGKQKHDAKEKREKGNCSVQFSQRAEAEDLPTSTPSNWNLGPDDELADKGPGHWSDDLIAAKKQASSQKSAYSRSLLPL